MLRNGNDMKQGHKYDAKLNDRSVEREKTTTSIPWACDYEGASKCNANGMPFNLNALVCLLLKDIEIITCFWQNSMPMKRSIKKLTIDIFSIIQTTQINFVISFHCSAFFPRFWLFVCLKIELFSWRSSNLHSNY